MLNILVVEDNQVERKNLIRMLKCLNKNLNIFQATTGEDAIKIVNEERISLFFLDIELPDFSGLKIAEKIRSMPQYELTYIVFITTHVYYQLEAFKKYHCYDFIEKPYKQEQVSKIFDRLIRGVIQNSNTNQAIRFEIKSCILKVFIRDILFIESQGKKCMVYTKSDQYTIPNMTMKQVLEKVAAYQFMQTHKSYIINLENIYRIEKHEKNAWPVYFKEYPLVAYISHKYRDIFLEQYLG
ncbi:two component transcriptional regulator, LytTR family [Alkaliphilus metalliredigens QYMF]|uniref:Stage 0 sporulation protein A homolog n=1 Tax=Alkaliphilus metalliredigens (strain QYMF) TaxID=293826 RepID=A6TVF0_ALKMQ|nr:LytTR family DNA-binding domain-containing protein [Alkaliphilus metalliredigens]ABR50168.1 two component transcriptional regulator, LytTR family [Alkaliphilus metalliredigens QYMF]